MPWGQSFPPTPKGKENLRHNPLGQSSSPVRGGRSGLTVSMSLQLVADLPEASWPCKCKDAVIRGWTQVPGPPFTSCSHGQVTSTFSQLEDGAC